MSKRIFMSVGHSLRVRGAAGFLDEVNEALKLTKALKACIEKNSDVQVATFFDTTSTTVSKNLSTIVSTHNRNTRQLDVSVHFNAFKTSNKNMGTEVLHFNETTRAIAADVSKAMANALKLNDRGAKVRKELAFLKGTNRAAILLEVCFVDSSVDAKHYNQYFDELVLATAKALVRAVKGVWKEAKKEVKSVVKINTSTIEKESKLFIEKAITVDKLLSDKTWVDKWDNLDEKQRLNLVNTILYRKFYK